jgi:hypothetical protein
MGTFSLNLNSLFQVGPTGSLTTNGWSWIDGTPLTDINSTPGQYYLIDHSAIAASLSFEVATNIPSFALDNGNTIEFSTLPLRIIFSNLTFNWGGQMFAIGATSHFVVTCGTYNSGNLNAGPYDHNTSPVPIDSGLSYTPTLLLGIVAKIALISSGNAAISSPAQVFSYDGIGINGTYKIVPYQSTIVTPTAPITPGTTPISIISPLAVLPSYNLGTTPGPYPGSAPTLSLQNATIPMNLLNIIQVDILYLDSTQILQTIVVPASTFTIQTQNLLTFTMPPIVGATPPVVTIVLVGDGTQFSGSVELGSLQTIYFIDGSGIYTLSPGATNDNLYVNGTNQTVATPIPTPYIKTALIP